MTVRDAAIVKAVLALGNALDLRVVAEGVETEALRQQLKHLGCQEAQGFLFGRPVESDQIPALLRSHETAERKIIRLSPISR